MAQNSALFAVAKIHMKQSKAIGQSDLSRLMDAEDFSAAKQVLVDIGFMPSIEEDYEVYADKYLSEACQTLRKYGPNEAMTQVFLLQYDAHNLKLLFKARLLNTEAEYLYSCGIVDLQKLRHMVLNHQYKALPKPLEEAMQELEKKSVTGIEPYLIDAIIDRALYKHLLALCKEAKNKKLSEYVAKRISFLNLGIALRLQKMQKGMDVLENLLLDGGAMQREEILKNFNTLHKLYVPLKAIDKAYALHFQKYLNGQISLSNLEMVADNSLLALYKDTVYAPLAVEHLPLYVIASQRQAAALRLVMAAKSSSASNDDIRERMRNIYAG